MDQGTIKKLVTERGFGFIESGSGPDLFFHATNLQAGISFESLTEGDRVTFIQRETEKGLLAENVTPV